MELLQLRYFLAAAEYQHITRAAEHLQIAQPALSQAIHRLETELGMPLFERKRRSIVLNDAGKLLQKRLLPIMDALDRIPEELQEYRSQTAHTIHLRILAASALITNRIIAYREEHGPFTSMEGLLEVSGIGEAKLAELEGWITIEDLPEGSDETTKE